MEKVIITKSRKNKIKKFRWRNFIKKNKIVLMTLSLGTIITISGNKILNEEIRRKEVLANYESRVQELEYELQQISTTNESLTYMYNDYQKENSLLRLTIEDLETKSEQQSEKLAELEKIVSESKPYDANNYSRGALENKPLNKYAVISVDELNEWIAERAPADSPFIGKAEIFLEAAKESELDPKYIIAHAGLESGWGTSDIARDKYNFFGISAFNHDPYNSAKTFDSFKQGIIEGAKWIKRNYIDNGQDTLSKMIYGDKDNVYCVNDDGTPSQSWIDKIVNIIL